MSAGTVECELLEDLDLDKVPPCEVFITWEGQVRCGKPSVARIKINCKTCSTDTAFVCRGCLDWLKQGEMTCHLCKLPNFTWTEI